MTIGIEPRLFMLILSDVLNSYELAALKRRLLTLKPTHVQLQGANKLLRPNQ